MFKAYYKHENYKPKPTIEAINSPLIWNLLLYFRYLEKEFFFCPVDRIEIMLLCYHYLPTIRSNNNKWKNNLYMPNIDEITRNYLNLRSQSYSTIKLYLWFESENHSNKILVWLWLQYYTVYDIMIILNLLLL